MNQSTMDYDFLMKKKITVFIYSFIYLFFLNAYIFVVQITSVNWGTDTDIFLITL